MMTMKLYRCTVLRSISSPPLLFSKLYYTIPYYTILYYTVLCCAVLYCTVLVPLTLHYKRKGEMSQKIEKKYKFYKARIKKKKTRFIK